MEFPRQGRRITTPQAGRPSMILGMGLCTSCGSGGNRGSYWIACCLSYNCSLLSEVRSPGRRSATQSLEPAHTCALSPSAATVVTVRDPRSFHRLHGSALPGYIARLRCPPQPTALPTLRPARSSAELHIPSRTPCQARTLPYHPRTVPAAEGPKA